MSVFKNRFLVILGMLLCGLTWGTIAARADVLFESATFVPGQIGSGAGVGHIATSIYDLGTTFTLNSPKAITGLTAHIILSTNKPQSFFGVVISLHDGKLPAPALESPFADADVVALGTCEVNSVVDSDIHVPVSAFVPAGDYAVIFGTGLYGTDGNGYIPIHDAPSPTWPSNTYFWTEENHSWQVGYTPEFGIRFAVEGGVPEPATLSLMALGMMFLGVRRRSV